MRYFEAELSWFTSIRVEIILNEEPPDEFIEITLREMRQVFQTDARSSEKVGEETQTFLLYLETPASGELRCNEYETGCSPDRGLGVGGFEAIPSLPYRTGPSTRMGDRPSTNTLASWRLFGRF